LRVQKYEKNRTFVKFLKK